LPAAIICLAIIAILLAGCTAGGPYVESTGLGRQPGHPRRLDFDDSQQVSDVALEGPAAVSGWNRIGAAYLYNSKVRSGAYFASSDH
jgi:hypothetical protein